MLPALLLLLSCSRAPHATPTPKPTPPPTPVPYANRGLSESAVLLYLGDWDGSQMFACTATCIKSAGFLGKGEFLTAAHCVTDNVDGKLKDTQRHINLAREVVGEETRFTRAEMKFLGSQDTGYDFAILESTLNVPALDLGDERTAEVGDEVLSWAGSMGLGIALTKGRIARLAVDRPLYKRDEHINWEGDLLLSLPIAPGASGSAVLDKNKKIVGVVVGGNSTYTFATPISRVLDVLKAADEATKAEKK